MTAKQIKEEVRSFVPSHNGDIHDGDGDERLCKEDIITFTKKTTTGMTTNKVTILAMGQSFCCYLVSFGMVLPHPPVVIISPSIDFRVPER